MARALPLFPTKRCLCERRRTSWLQIRAEMSKLPSCGCCRWSRWIQCQREFQWFDNFWSHGNAGRTKETCLDLMPCGYKIIKTNYYPDSKSIYLCHAKQLDFWEIQGKEVLANFGICLSMGIHQISRWIEG